MLDEEKNPYRPFHLGVEPKYARDRGFTIEHTRLAVRIDERKKTIRGTATLSGRPIHKIDAIELDASDLTIEDVRLDGRRARFETVGENLIVHSRRALKEAQPFQVEVRYHGAPRKGLYFIQPDKEYPKKPYQVWSQGESEDNHNWFPGYDYPNNKASSEALITVRKPLIAISNGHLVANKNAGAEWHTFHWRQEVRQPNYLIALVVGEFDEVRSEWDGVPLHAFVPKGQKKWAEETFKQTASILAFFSKATGYRYPYPKYAQAVIADFMWGGMENTSMTTVNERFLILPKHREDADPDGLVAHEAAHQWFGDLVTTKSWEHLWLNEGFATYFDALWHESFHGPDVFQLELFENAEAYFAEDKGLYRRPIVTRNYAENEDLFDRHTYQKGSLVLHMLRHELGDDLWWKSVRHYLKKFEWKNAETTDLKVAIEEATGRNLDWFFDQWLHKAGHPDLEARWEFDEAAKAVKLSIKQAQRVVGDTPLFRIPLTVWVWSSPSRQTKHKILVKKTEESFFLPTAKRPELVQIDPDGVVLKTLSFDKGAKEWTFQLANSPRAFARIEACDALKKKPSDPATIPALAKALRRDKFWGVRRQAAMALGEIGTPTAREALAPGIDDKHPRVRRGVGAALGNFKRDPEAGKISERLLRDRSDYVVAAALAGVAKQRHARAFDLIKQHVGRESHNEVITTTALVSFAELKDARGLSIAMENTRYGVHPYVRAAATACLARLWDFVEKRDQEEIRDRLTQLFKDPSHAERRSALAASAEIPDGRLAAEVTAQAETEPIGLLRKVARDSLRRMREKLADRTHVGDLRKQFEELQSQNKKLEGRLSELEAKLKPRGRKKK